MAWMQMDALIKDNEGKAHHVEVMTKKKVQGNLSEFLVGHVAAPIEVGERKL